MKALRTGHACVALFWVMELVEDCYRLKDLSGTTGNIVEADAFEHPLEQIEVVSA